MKYQTLLTIILLTNNLLSYAEIITDGTLGSAFELSGPNYQIGAELGQQHGSNLFHSFRDFNLQSHESATFSGPNSINNVISRVTGGNPSSIDGLLRSTIPNADMYFLNPYGIMFGPNAKLDVPGSFHASTADYLRLSDGGQFNARQPNNSLLTIAPIEAFGFLTNNPAFLSTQDSELSVPPGKHFSLIGGDLRLSGNSPIQFDEKGFMVIFASSKLSAQTGRVNLASVASQGEVVPHPFGIDFNAQGGKITLDNTLIDVSGQGGGEVFIRGGQFVMQDATIQSNTFADIEGKNIDMQFTESIDIRGDLLAILNQTFGSGKSGDIVIKVPRLDVTGSWIATVTTSTGNSGNIDIDAKQVLLEKGGSLMNGTYGSGAGGNLYIKAEKILSVKGRREGNITMGNITYEDFPSSVETATFNEGPAGMVTIETDNLHLVGSIIGADSFGKGDGGDLAIYANTANLTGGALITSSAFSSGKAGKLNLTITDTLSASGRRSNSLIVPMRGIIENNQSGISTVSLSLGQAGHIFIETNTLLLADDGFIGAGTASDGAGGNVVVQAHNINIKNGADISSSSGIKYGSLGLRVGHGDGGNVVIQTEHFTLNNGEIQTFSAGSGNAGNLIMQANTINIINGGSFKTSATNAAGGNIEVTTANLLYLRDGQITTSVGAGKGQGGDIKIENPLLVVLDGGQIKAQADEGHGGDINISSNRFIASNDSLVSASSKLGIDGNVNIDSPDVNLEEFLVVLPGGFVEANLTRCDIQEIENLSSFKIIQAQDSLPFARKNSQNNY